MYVRTSYIGLRLYLSIVYVVHNYVDIYVLIHVYLQNRIFLIKMYK